MKPSGNWKCNAFTNTKLENRRGKGKRKKGEENSKGKDMRRMMYNTLRDVKEVASRGDWDSSISSKKMRPVFSLIHVYLNCLPQCFLVALDRSDCFPLLYYLSCLSVQIYSLTINTLRAETLPGTDSSFFKWAIDTRGHSRKVECVIRTKIHILGSCSLNILQLYQSNPLHHVHTYFMVHSCTYVAIALHVFRRRFTQVLYVVYL